MKFPKLSNKQQIIIVAVSIALFATFLTVAAASYTSSLQQTVNYTKSAISITWTEDPTVTYTGVDTITRTYTVTNNGNVAETITASASCTDGSATFAWDKTSASPIASGASATFTLTINVSKDGQSTVSFHATKA